MSIPAPDEISMEDPLCDSSLGSMVTLDYVTPLTLDEVARTTAAATCALNEDTNAAAAIEKTKRRNVMSKSQENKNEKTSEGDDDTVKGGKL